MKITNAKKLIPAVKISVLVSENLKYLHRKNISIHVPAYDIRNGRLFTMRSASISQIKNIPSDTNTRYSENTRFMNRDRAHAEAIVKANAK